MRNENEKTKKPEAGKALFLAVASGSFTSAKELSPMSPAGSLPTAETCRMARRAHTDERRHGPAPSAAPREVSRAYSSTRPAERQRAQAGAASRTGRVL